MSSVSVIIPTYNRARLLHEAIASVLSQDFANTEVVVVDDGSTDDIPAVVSDFGQSISYIRQPNSGASTARNMGVLHSSGDYLVFLDSDDVLLPGMVRKLAGALDKNPDSGVAYCGFVELDQNGDTRYVSPLDQPNGDVFVEMCVEYLCIVHSVMIRRACLAKVGLFDPAMTMYEDMDLNTRLAAHCQFVFVPEHLVAYRLAHCDLSHRKDDVANQRALFVSKLEPWYRSGRLDRTHWRYVRQRLYGLKPSEKHMRDAGLAYVRCDFTTAFTLAMRAALRDPRYLVSRAWGSVFVKSGLRIVSGKRQTGPEAVE